VKPLTEAQAWTIIAARFDEVCTRCSGVRAMGGVCKNINRLEGTGLITDTMACRMHNRKDRYEPAHGRAYWWPVTLAGAEQRRDFCRRMAALAER